jgi:uncharacterized membrane protein
MAQHSVATVDDVRPVTATAARITSIDVVRGVVMVLMAIDHVRVYAGVPAGGPSPAVFLTRWVTHFCAPAFVFFAGTSAFLSGRRRSRAELSRFLVTRGAWLVALELTVLRIAWTFNVDFAHYILLGVIWMIGVCMILMAALVHLPTIAVGVFGLVVILGQNLVGGVAGALPQWLGQILYFGGVINAGENGPAIAVLYSIVPWIGVMAAGYAFGAIVTRESEERRRLWLRIGLSATALFIVFAAIDLFLNAARGAPALSRVEGPPAWIRVLNQRKYPASQLFLLMTLGPTIALMPIAEKAKNAIGDLFATFGRVPLFYYLLHIPLIHASAIVVSLVREGRVNPWLFGNHPMMPPPVPPGYMWSLPLLYLVFAIDVAILYIPCRWFARVRAERRNSILRYL